MSNLALRRTLDLVRAVPYNATDDGTPVVFASFLRLTGKHVKIPGDFKRTLHYMILVAIVSHTIRLV
jgi:hypothetical protein